jgi:hypothetical protein
MNHGGAYLMDVVKVLPLVGVSQGFKGKFRQAVAPIIGNRLLKPLLFGNAFAGVFKCLASGSTLWAVFFELSSFIGTSVAFHSACEQHSELRQQSGNANE